MAEQVNVGFTMNSDRGTNPKADGSLPPRGVPEYAVEGDAELKKLAEERWKNAGLRTAWTREFSVDDTEDSALFKKFYGVCKLWQERLKKDSNLEISKAEVEPAPAFSEQDVEKARAEGAATEKAYAAEFYGRLAQANLKPKDTDEFVEKNYGKPMEEVIAAFPKK